MATSAKVKTHAHTHIYIDPHTCCCFALYSHQGFTSCEHVLSGTDFGLGAGLGEMSGLVAVSTVDILAGVVSVWHTRVYHPGTFVFVVYLRL